MEFLSVVYQRDREKTDLVFNYNKLQWLCVLILAETRTSFSTVLWKVYLYMYVYLVHKKYSSASIFAIHATRGNSF